MTDMELQQIRQIVREELSRIFAPVQELETQLWAKRAIESARGKAAQRLNKKKAPDPSGA